MDGGMECAQRVTDYLHRTGRYAIMFWIVRKEPIIMEDADSDADTDTYFFNGFMILAGQTELHCLYEKWKL